MANRTGYARDSHGRFARTNTLLAAARSMRGDGPTSNTGLRNALRRNQGNSKEAIAGRIKALPPSKRAAVREKFIKEGPTTNLKAKLERNLTTRMTNLNRQASSGSSTRPPRTAQSQAERRGGAAYGFTTPAATARPLTRAERRANPTHDANIRERLARARTSNEQRVQAAAHEQRRMARTNIMTTATRGLNQPASTTGHRNFIAARPLARVNGATDATIKRNVSQRIHQIGPEGRARLTQKFVEHGLTTRLKANLQTKEGEHQRELGRASRAARREAALHPEMAAARATLAGHPHFADVASSINSSNLPYVKELLSKVTPAEFHNHVMQGMTADATVRYSLSGNTLTWNASGGGISSMTRNMHLDQKLVYHAYFQVDPSVQGGGMGKAAFKGLFQLYDKVGIKYVDVTANIDVGGYAWARYGFAPKDPARIKSMVDNYRNNTRDPLTATHRAMLESISQRLGRGDAKAMWDLVDHKEPIILASGRTSMVNGKPRTPAKSLLLGTNWSGRIDLTDPVNKTRAHKYVGIL